MTSRQPRPEPPPWEATCLLDIPADPPAPPALIEAEDGGFLLYDGVLQLISGEPETGKTWIALIAAVQMMRVALSVLWIDTDGAGPGDTLERLRSLGATDADLLRFRYIEPPGPPSYADPRRALVAICQGVRPSLIVWDSLSAAMALYAQETGKDNGVENFRRFALGVWPGATELLLDHVNKDPENRGDYSTGSYRKQALVKAHLRLAAPRKLSREQPGLIKIRATKDRPGFHRRGKNGAIGELHLTPDGSGRIEWSLQLGTQGSDSDDFRPTFLMEKVSRFLERVGQPQSKNQIEKEVAGRGTYVRQAVDVLVDEGFVATESGPRNATLHRLVTPFYDLVPTSSPPRPGRTQATSSLVPPPIGDEDEVAILNSRPRPGTYGSGMEPS